MLEVNDATYQFEASGSQLAVRSVHLQHLQPAHGRSNAPLCTCAHPGAHPTPCLPLYPPRAQAVVFIYLSWRDTRVAEQIRALEAPMRAGNYTCTYTCQSSDKALAGGCCDDVWQPYIAMTNIKYLPQVGRLGCGVAARTLDAGMIRRDECVECA